jgi:Flp pilus assembly protein TadD
MKNTDKHSLAFGLPLFALALLCFVPVTPAQAAGGQASSGDTVSAIGGTPAPATETPSDPTATPTNGEFPPQPVSVAPTEDATPTVTTTTTTTTTETPAVAPATNAAPQPSAQALTPIPQAADGSVAGTNVMGDSGVKQKHSGTYYDSSALAKSGATGPRKVDPAYEPGQTYVVVAKGPKAASAEGQYVAATRALKLGRYAAAMEMFEKLYKKNHKDPRILMGLAVAQQGAGFNESAARTYEDLLKVQPNNADAIVNLMGIMRGQYPSVTLKKLTELRSKYPTNPGIPAQMGLVNAELKNYDDSIRDFQVAASMDPRNSSHIYNMAIVTDQKGDTSNAIKLYEQALQLDATYGDVATSLPRDQIYDRLVVLRRKV